ncbi:MAG: esterase/lipase superfamily enzyme [Mariniblastus sp.]|jgi:esterase/lipase superfamily enzyme
MTGRYERRFSFAIAIALACGLAGCGAEKSNSLTAESDQTHPQAETVNPIGSTDGNADSNDKQSQGALEGSPELSLKPIQPSVKSTAPRGQANRVSPNQPDFATGSEPPEFAAEESPSEARSAPYESTNDALTNTPNKSPTASKAGPQSDKSFTTVPVFYGTDRSQSLAEATASVPLKLGYATTIMALGLAVISLAYSRPKTGLSLGTLATVVFLFVYSAEQNEILRQGIKYGTQRGEFVRGLAMVTIPKNHERGIIERPSLLRFEFKEDQAKHIVLTQATELALDVYYDQMQHDLANSAAPDLLIFIHGFNVDFDSAVRRTAQISTDLSFEGVSVCYSWPSQASLMAYSVDENNVTWTTSHLRDFLIELSEQSGARSINVIAHSMGNRALTASLAQLNLVTPQEKLPLLDQVVLAAPDVDADHFRNELAPQIANVANQVTLYASSDDQALAVSKYLHGGYARAGESGTNLVVTPGVETIDVSGIDLSLLGHSYYGTSQSILKDLFGVVGHRLPAAERVGLIAREWEDAPYWMLPRPQVSEARELKMR